ncbi:MAG: ABC transporter permease, partial [Deltaproteobacteria bacterium]|nr:ABC transporter permease [Deltaproteobacteria bacterium]
MGDIGTYVLPAARLLGVIAGAIALVSLLVGGMLAVLRGVAGRGAFASWRLMLALRILVGYRREGHPVLSRVPPVSAQNLIAMVGTAIGVWALIVVLSVMGGLETDLKGKIVRHSPHVTVRPSALPDGPRSWDALVAGLTATPHVASVEPMVEAEAMLTSPVNMSPGLVIRGVHPGGALERLWLAPTTD